MKQIQILEEGLKGAKSEQRVRCLSKSILYILVLICGNSLFAQYSSYGTPQYVSPRSNNQPPGYYYNGNQTQAIQSSGQYYQNQGIQNGGYNMSYGGVGYGVSGYNNYNTYTSNGNRTNYQQVPQYYYNNGNNCGATIYSGYQIPNGSPVYQTGKPYYYVPKR